MDPICFILRHMSFTTTFSYRYGFREAIRQFLSMRAVCKKYNNAVLLNTFFWKNLYKLKTHKGGLCYALAAIHEIREDVLRKRLQQIHDLALLIVKFEDAVESYTTETPINKRYVYYHSLVCDRTNINKYLKRLKKMKKKHRYYFDDFIWLMNKKSLFVIF